MSLVGASDGFETLKILKADIGNAAGLLTLQKLAYQSEAAIYQDWTIDPLVETIVEMHEAFDTHTFLVAKVEDRIVGSIRARLVNGACEIS